MSKENHPHPPAERLSPAWLTEQLRLAGRLPQGRVITAGQRANAAFNSHLAHLELTYTEDAPVDAPRRLVAKQSLAEAWAVAAGRREVNFYRLIASLPAPLPMIVPCILAQHEPETGRSILLLEDLSESHTVALSRDAQLAAGENIPPETTIVQVVEALARFHAAWWEHPALGKDPALIIWRAARAAWEQHAQRVSAAWARLRAGEGAALPEETRALCDQALPNLPRLWETEIAPRTQGPSQLTLTHGDAYFANFLVPKTPWSAPTYLIDWQSPWVDWGTLDLVPLCAAFWTPAQRREGQRERRMLQSYYDALRQAGVEHYSWEQLLHDYRLALIDWLLIPIVDWSEGASPAYWQPKLACLSAAYQDWDCGALLTP